jgi:uncharacterized damage-inducible protein DinB
MSINAWPNTTMRLLRLGIAAMVLSACASAQRTVTPAASTKPIVDTFLSFGYYGGWLLAAFDSIPASRYEYRPTAPQQSIGYIAQHLESANHALCDVLSPMKHPASAGDSLADTVKAKWPKDTLVARLRASLIFCRDVLETLTDAQLAEEITVHFPGNPERRAPRVRFVILLFTDLAEHYAQLASYMRLLGMVPPSALPRPG